jgi:hypothetical protein
MSRIPQETIDKLNAFLDMIPSDVRGKCTMCTETLTHWVKKAEVETGAGTSTVTKAFAARHNENAAPMDRVTPEQLRGRVIYHEGKSKCGNSTDKQSAEKEGKLAPPPKEEMGTDVPTPPKKEKKYVFDNDAIAGTAMYFLAIALGNMNRIMDDDPDRTRAFQEMIEWCQQQIGE